MSFIKVSFDMWRVVWIHWENFTHPRCEGGIVDGMHVTIQRLLTFTLGDKAEMILFKQCWVYFQVCILMMEKKIRDIPSGTIQNNQGRACSRFHDVDLCAGHLLFLLWTIEPLGNSICESSGDLFGSTASPASLRLGVWIYLLKL